MYATLTTGSAIGLMNRFLYVLPPLSIFYHVKSIALMLDAGDRDGTVVVVGLILIVSIFLTDFCCGSLLLWSYSHRLFVNPYSEASLSLGTLP